jgi:uncharacterized DUF497 family protein
MEFEWDAAKRLANIEKHKIDLASGVALFDGRPIYRYPSPRLGEDRFVSIGWLAGDLVALVWMQRGDVTRLISLRRARNGEKREFRALYG